MEFVYSSKLCEGRCKVDACNDKCVESCELFLIYIFNLYGVTIHYNNVTELESLKSQSLKSSIQAIVAFEEGYDVIHRHSLGSGHSPFCYTFQYF
jgi:hypothetical protein